MQWNVRNGEMRYFDSRDETVHLDHVLASCAPPPAFPAVRIDGDPYWDGGIYSNTPIEAVLDDKPRQDSVIFTVHMWNPEGAEPETLWQVMGHPRRRDAVHAEARAGCGWVVGKNALNGVGRTRPRKDPR